MYWNIIIVWSLDFRNGRKQLVKSVNLYLVLWRFGLVVINEVTLRRAGLVLRWVNVATPQGTVSGPNDLKLVPNDLKFNTN